MKVVVVATQNEEMARSANQQRVFSPLDQSRVSNFAPGGRKIKKQKCPLFKNHYLQKPQKGNCRNNLIIISYINSMQSYKAIEISSCRI